MNGARQLGIVGDIERDIAARVDLPAELGHRRHGCVAGCGKRSTERVERVDRCISSHREIALHFADRLQSEVLTRFDHSVGNSIAGDIGINFGSHRPDKVA